MCCVRRQTSQEVVRNISLLAFIEAIASQIVFLLLHFAFIEDKSEFKLACHNRWAASESCLSHEAMGRGRTMQAIFVFPEAEYWRIRGCDEMRCSDVLGSHSAWTIIEVGVEGN